MRQALAGCAAVFLAVAVAAAPPGRGAAAGPCQRTVDIDAQVTAGERAGTLTLAVRSVGCPAAGAVAYTVTAGSALPEADFTLSGGTLRWAAGDTGVRSIVATVADDTVREAALEDFVVKLSAPSAGVVVRHGAGQARILDDDGPCLSWALDAGFIPMLGHAYSCLGPPPLLTFVWSTEDGTAKAGVDYVAVTNQAQTVPAGSPPVALLVTQLPRPAGTPSRWFTVRLVSVGAGTIVDAVAVVTIDGS